MAREGETSSVDNDLQCDVEMNGVYGELYGSREEWRGVERRGDKSEKI